LILFLEVFAASPKGLVRGRALALVVPSAGGILPTLGKYRCVKVTGETPYQRNSSRIPGKGLMKTPAALQPLIDDGVIDEVIRSLKSGKEATVYLVRSGAHTRCAKVYRDMRQRSFQKRARYQEGRKVRGSRHARAISKRTRFGRKEQEAAWKNAEVDALYRLAAAGVRVPRPFGYFNGTLIMELVTDATGDPAPRLGEVDLSAETAREYHCFLVQQIVRMLSVGLIHGDLSEFNVLVGSQGPVIIDLPQAVNAAGNNGAFPMLERDVNNIRGTLGRFAPELLETEFAREMWAQFEQGELTADSKLTGAFARDETKADAAGVLLAVEDAREEALQRELGREG
jgi:RIO kinase 1